MKKSQLIAITALTAVLTGAAIYLLKKNRRRRRLTVVSDAGYETAYDIHYPVRYRRG